MTFPQFLIAASLGLAPLFLGTTSYAQSSLVPAPDTASQVAGSTENSYSPEYFKQFQPNTARDMVSRIPGFALQGGGGGNRGFGQASLNILINGRRPSSKTSGAQDILGRIPSNKVVRIDIKDGASLDIPGLSGQVADIITGGSGISGSWDYALRFWEGTDPQIQDGKISISGERGDVSYTLGFNSREFKFTEDGIETFADADGNVFEDRVEQIYARQTRPTIDVNLTYTPANGHVANFNGTIGYGNRNQGVDESFIALNDRGNTGQSVFQGGEDELEYEIGGDYAFPAGPGTLKLIGLHRFEDSKNADGFRLFNIGETPFIQSFKRDTLEGEYIGRAEYNFSSSARHDWQISGEGAFNYLDRDERYEDSDTPLELSNVRVEEKRAEGNITHSWNVSGRFDLQSSLGAEYSQITVPSDGTEAREFVRPKGFISASYSPSETYTWRAKVEREVGQLDFNLFTDGISLTDSFESSGNSQIVPTQSWNAELELARQDADVISGTVKAFVTFIEDPIDRIRFLDGSEGPGNLDSALEYGIEANATWLLSSIGIDGMRLELEGALRDSEIDDPLTGITRRVNDTEIWEWEVDLRYDVPDTPYAFGGGLEQDRESPFLRLDQSFDGYFDRPESYLFAEHKSLFGMTVRLFAQGLLNEKILRPRIIYDGDRTGDIIEIQNFERARGRRISLELSDTF